MLSLISSGLSISIHTLRMEGDYVFVTFFINPFKISIHTLRMEGDILFSFLFFIPYIFQSTPSAWRVTAKAHKKTARFCSKVTDLRRNCRPDVHERTEGSLWQAVFAG